jgi:hypothetical protein
MNKRISQLPSGSPNLNYVVPADNQSGTQTEKITLGQILDLRGSSIGYRVSATTTDDTPTTLTGDSLALETGEAWQFEIKLVSHNCKNDTAKTWSIRGGIKNSFGGSVILVGPLDTQASGDIGGGSVSVTAQSSSLVIKVTGITNTKIDWVASILTSEKVSTQQAKIGGCTDPDASNYNLNADYDNNSCSYSAPPSTNALELISAGSTITSLSVTVDANQLYPAFDPTIYDYYVKTSVGYGSQSDYTYSINEDAPVTENAKAGRTLQITDGTNYYYVRLLPNDVETGTSSYGPTEDYVPGYYLSARPVTGGSSYHYIYDHRGVPIWYGLNSEKTPASTHFGRYSNRIALNRFSSDADRAIVQINSASASIFTYSILTSPTYGTPSWDIHDIQEIALPISRSGNILGIAYDSGFYIQEQTSDGKLVWEWHSQDYFTSQDNEYYHLNSVDVHPITGNILCSLRNCSAVLSINYVTKDVEWVLQGNSHYYDTLQAQAISSKTLNTKWLSTVDEPTFDSYQYDGTGSQHDARWRHDLTPLTYGNELISIYDNQTYDPDNQLVSTAGPRSRGVIYEINSSNGTAVHRSSIFSENGTSPYIGSYTIVEDGGKLSHSIDFSTEHPCLVEYIGSVGNTKTKVLSLDFNGNVYRIIKVPLTSFRLDNLRAICGINIDSNTLLSG